MAKVGQHANFNQSVLKRAMQVAGERGMVVRKIDIYPDGRIILHGKEDRDVSSANPWDVELP